MDEWATLGVEGHWQGRPDWFRYDELVASRLTGVVGGSRSEVAVGGTLTANLHVLLASFYRPTRHRRMVLAERTSFPSDRYALVSQIEWHDLDPRDTLVEIEPGPTQSTTDAVCAAVESLGDELALVWLGGVNYLTGELLDMEAITAAAHSVGSIVGFDLAHAAGNVPLSLHDWGVDLAAWCSYKYLCSGPGSVAGWFVHERHLGTIEPTFAGWWGNEPATRFDMDQERDFVPRPTADGWKSSNPPILSLAAVDGASSLFEEVGMAALRAKSERLTALLVELLDERTGLEVLTPRQPDRRGNQISVVVPGRAAAVQSELAARGVVIDDRPPDVLRLAPSPLYTTYEEVWRAVEELRRVLTA